MGRRYRRNLIWRTCDSCGGRTRFMFERYTEKARRVIFFARYEASQYGSARIESEHLLLGVVREERAPVSQIESIRKDIESQITIGERVSTSVDMPLSQECERILKHAGEEAERLGDKHVGTEHLLLGIRREDKCLGARILQRHDVSTRAQEWCCPEFEKRCYQAGTREHGLGIIMWFHSRGPKNFALEYRHPDRAASDPVAADAVKLDFCPWCGRNLAGWYSSGLPPFNPE